jgi:hypothetical protein
MIRLRKYNQHVIQVTSVYQMLSRQKKKQTEHATERDSALVLVKISLTQIPILWISHIIHHPHITPANFFSNNIINNMLCCKITPCAAKTLNLCNLIFLYWIYRMRMRRGTKVAPHVLHAI